MNLSASGSGYWFDPSLQYLQKEIRVKLNLHNAHSFIAFRLDLQVRVDTCLELYAVLHSECWAIVYIVAL